MTIFSLFLFVILLMVAGMAVDMVHQEQRRVAMQNAVDSAVLASTSLTQTLDQEALVKDYVAKAGFDPDSVAVTTVNEHAGNGIGLVSRQVSVISDVSTDTMFMGLMGFSSLSSPADSSAIESSENVEISLILDISDSMNWASADPSKSKISALQEAAKTFVDAVFATNDPQRVSISIIPYNHQVYASQELLSRLPLNDATTPVTAPATYPGSLTSYQVGDLEAPCLIFDDADFQTLSLGASGGFDRSSSFLSDNYHWGMNGLVQQQYEAPYEWAKWCGDHYAKILPFSNDPVALKTHIDSLEAQGATAINLAMNWGLGLLDNSMQGVVTDMIAANELSADVAGRPFAYNAPSTHKFVILMTDGANTNQRDMKPEFKEGPTRAWYAPSAATGTVSYDDTQVTTDQDGNQVTTVTPVTRDKNSYDSYFVLMPNNPADQRWYVPGSPWTTADDQYVPETDLPADAMQLDYHELYNRFGVRSAARFLFQHSDFAAYSAHFNGMMDAGGWGVADTRLDQLCTEAKTRSTVKVFSVAFEAPASGQTALQNCAYAPGYYFDVDGTDIKTAFQSIASQIAVLRLKE
ncbi:pilus assembly protein TadG-related protein [Silicimonas sp. MF1-12-2]|uniref:pilus assembly protein TadG-related protein n=1 Tax=Silicimonas sp. MF1-12-2 TaxID=3384793 RepID=UPI0039B3EB28